MVWVGGKSSKGKRARETQHREGREKSKGDSAEECGGGTVLLDGRGLYSKEILRGVRHPV